MKLTYFCPVCGYDQLDEPAANHSICPCCGTHFGYHDVGQSWSDLRAKWMLRGMPWFSSATAKPRDWKPVDQLRKLMDLEQIRLTANPPDKHDETQRLEVEFSRLPNVA